MEEMEAQLGDRQPESTRRVQGRSEVFTHFVPGPQPVNTPNAPSPHSHEGNDSRDSRRRYTSRLNENVLKHDVRYVSTDELECTSVTQFTPGSNLRARSSRGRSARVMESMLQLISAMEASGDECMCVCTHARVGRCPRRRVHAHRTVLLCAYIHTQINLVYEYCLQKGPKKKNNNLHPVNAIIAYMPRVTTCSRNNRRPYLSGYCIAASKCHVTPGSYCNRVRRCSCHRLLGVPGSRERKGYWSYLMIYLL